MKEITKQNCKQGTSWSTRSCRHLVNLQSTIDSAIWHCRNLSNYVIPFQHQNVCEILNHQNSTRYSYIAVKICLYWRSLLVDHPHIHSHTCTHIHKQILLPINKAYFILSAQTYKITNLKILIQSNIVLNKMYTREMCYGIAKRNILVIYQINIVKNHKRNGNARCEII